MGRAKRADEAGVISHLLNWANRRASIFHKGADYEAFGRIIAEALDRMLELFSFCLMPSHWHLVVSLMSMARWVALGSGWDRLILSVTTRTTTPPVKAICIQVGTS